MLASNTINYMKFVATDLIGYEPEGKLYTPEGAPYLTEWMMRAPGDIIKLARGMKSYGYTINAHGKEWIGVSGHPTNMEAVRDLEMRGTAKRTEWLSTAREDELHQLTNRF